MRDDVTRSCDLEYITTSTHTHTPRLCKKKLCVNFISWVSASHSQHCQPVCMNHHQRLTNQNRPPPKQFGSFPAGLSLFVMHILLHGFPSETPPTSSFCVRAKITLKALDKVSLEAKPHWKTALHQTCHHGRHVTDIFCFGHAQQKPCTAKQSAQRQMILMRMSLAKPESLAHVHWFCALHVWDVRLPCKSHQWSNGTFLFYMDGMGWGEATHPAPFQPTALWRVNCYTLIHLYRNDEFDVLASWFGFVLFFHGSVIFRFHGRF